MLKRPSTAPVIALLVLALIAILIFKRGSSNWIDIGKGGPKKWQDYPYRFIDLTGGEDLPSTHPDLTSLTLSLQSERSRGAWVYLPVYHCYAPQVRDGVPSVKCDSINGADVIIAGADNVREVLLGLKSGGKRGAVQGKAIGLYADHPVIWVNDPMLKPEHR